MNAARFIETLIKLGTAVKDARGSQVDWDAFLRSDTFHKLEQAAASLVDAAVTTGNWTAAVTAVDGERARLLGGRDLHDLSWNELVTYNKLVMAREALTTRALAQSHKDAAFWSWLTEKVLPVLVDVAPVVVPLLS